MDAVVSTRPLDWLADFPAIPEGWAYLDSAATAQKPRPVIEAITRGYAETYATVHRGVYHARPKDGPCEPRAASSPVHRRRRAEGSCSSRRDRGITSSRKLGRANLQPGYRSSLDLELT